MENWVMCKLREIYAEKGCLDMLDTDLKTRSRYGLLDEILNYEGIIGYTSWILGLVENIYGVKLPG